MILLFLFLSSPTRRIKNPSEVFNDMGSQLRSAIASQSFSSPQSGTATFGHALSARNIRSRELSKRRFSRHHAHLLGLLRVLGLLNLGRLVLALHTYVFLFF